MFVHCDNLARKDIEYASDSTLKNHLAQIRSRYNQWKTDNMQLVGPVSTPSDNDSAIIAERVRLFNDYKDFID